MAERTNKKSMVWIGAESGLAAFGVRKAIADPTLEDQAIRLGNYFLTPPSCVRLQKLDRYAINVPTQITRAIRKLHHER